MKIRLERGGVTFEYERPPMKEGRFRTLCALAAGVLYMGLTWIIVSGCGIVGLLPLAFVTLAAIGLDKL